MADEDVVDTTIQPRPNQAVVPYQPNNDKPFDEHSLSFVELKEMAKIFSASGMFKDCDEGPKAFTKMLVAKDLGISMTRGLLDINMISGKPALSANLIAGMIKKSGKYKYKIVEHTDEVCKLEVFERDNGTWDSLGYSSFSIKDAEKAGLLRNPTWKSYPRNMLFSRAISNVAKQFCGDIFLGSVYTPDELDNSIEYDSEGNVVDGSTAKTKRLSKTSVSVISSEPDTSTQVKETKESVKKEVKDLILSTEFDLDKYLKDNKSKSLDEFDIDGLKALRVILKLKTESNS